MERRTASDTRSKERPKLGWLPQKWVLYIRCDLRSNFRHQIAKGERRENISRPRGSPLRVLCLPEVLVSHL